MYIKMPTNFITKEFIYFLKYYGIYDYFLNYAGLGNEDAVSGYINRCRNNKISDFDFIEQAFDWDETASGSIFWGKMHNKWCENLLDINKIIFKNLKSIW